MRLRVFYSEVRFWRRSRRANAPAFTLPLFLSAVSMHAQAARPLLAAPRECSHSAHTHTPSRPQVPGSSLRRFKATCFLPKLKLEDLWALLQDNEHRLTWDRNIAALDTRVVSDMSGAFC